MDPALYFVALVSFFLGSFAYVIARFIVIPPLRYRNLKRRVSKCLAGYMNASDAKGKKASAQTIRRLSVELSDCFRERLPHWYKVYLEGRRGEKPVEAAKLLMALSNAGKPSHAARQAADIKACLKLKQ